MSLIKNILNLFVYKEKPQEEVFELLETPEDDSFDDEGYRSDKKQASDSSEVEEKSEVKIKVPLSYEKWKDTRNKINQEVKQGVIEDSIYTDIDKNLERIKKEFRIPQNSDINIREFNIFGKTKAFIIYIEGLVDKKTLNETIKGLMKYDGDYNKEEVCIVQYLADNVIALDNIVKEKKFNEVEKFITKGFTALFIDDSDTCILLETIGYEKRGIEKPENETAVQGSHESFVEDLYTNISLIRRLIKNKNLMVETMTVGAESNLQCAIIYLDGIINPEIPKEIKKRISKVKSEIIFTSGMLEQYIEDNKWSLFPQIIQTERSDRAISAIVEGKALVLLEGSPLASAMPITFFHLFHTSEDNNLRWYYGSLISLIRIIGIFMAVFLPGFYIAFVLYSQEMIPSELLASIVSAREGVPFPTILELMLMEIAFELIREAALRVPGSIGMTLGIVGALILGQAAVEAGLVSPMLIIVVAAAGIGGFVVPDYALSMAIRIAKFLFIFLGYIAGIYSISLGMFIFFAIMCSTKSFGVSYLSPIAPKLRTSPDIILTKPIEYMKYRPDELSTLKKRKKNK